MNAKTSIASLFSGIPTSLRDELVNAFSQIERNYREHRWEPAELNGGKICEIVYTIIKGHFDGNFPTKASKPKNMLDACRKLENSPSTFPRSLRIQIPRMLISLYEIRNNRGVGHVGGDVNPNEMDAICVLHMSKWIVSELIRVFHNVSVSEAQSAVSALSNRELSLIWEVDGIARVLDTNLKMSDQTLILLYSQISGMDEKDLIESLEHSNPSVYRRDVLRKLHKKRLIEFNEKLRTAKISPLGSEYVENNILKTSV